MKKATKTILMSALTIASCASLIAGATFALFTSESEVNIAVTSGKVDVQATVNSVHYASDITDTYAEWTEATKSGDEYVGTFANNGTVNYSTSENKLTLTDIAPGDAVKFGLGVINRSTIAVKYLVRLGAAEDTGLFSLLSIKADGKELSGSPAVVSDWEPLNIPSGGEETVKNIDVVVALPSTVTSEQGAGKSCSIILTLVAVQGNGQTCADEGVAHHYVDDVCTWCGAANPFTKTTSSIYPDSDYYPVREYTGTEENVVIPAEINGKRVAIASNSLMQNNKTVKSVTVESGITNLQQYTFDGCTNLEEVHLPDTLERLMSSMFRGCTSLKKVTVPASVKKVDNEIFERSAIEEIEFISEGSQLEEVNWLAFAGCDTLTKLTLPDRAFHFKGIWGTGDTKKMMRNTKLYNTEDNWESDKYGNQVLYIGNHLIAVKPKLEGSTIQGLEIRPGTIDIAPVFWYNLNSGTYKITEPVEIPDSVELIGMEAFGVTESKHVAVTPVFGADSNLKYIGKKAFYHCVAREDTATITLPASIEHIDSLAFALDTYNRSTLTVNFADSDSYHLQYVATDAFSGYNSSEGVYDNGRYIGSESNPYMILAGIVDNMQESFVVQNGTEFIVAKFGSQLTSITLSNTLKIIYTGTFASCKNLASITIPASVMRIEGNAFGHLAKDESRVFSVTLEGEGKWYWGRLEDSEEEELREITGVDFGDPTSIGASMIKYVVNAPYLSQYGLRDWVRVVD